MLNDFQKSIRLIVTERLTSPFSGAFFFSWFVWNWKAVYYLLFPSENLTLADRLQYVHQNYLDWGHNLIYPILSAAFLVVIYPFVTTAALWFWLRFRKWQSDIKNEVERSQLLTLEQSVEIRLAIYRQREEFDRLLKSKDDEIALLRRHNDELVKQSSQQTSLSPSPSPQAMPQEDTPGEISAVLQRPAMRQHLSKLIELIQGNNVLRTDSFTPEILAYFVGNNFIEKRPGDIPRYDFTDKGKVLLKEFSKQQLH